MLDSSERSFGRVFAAFFFLLTLRQAYRGHWPVACVLLGISFAFLLLSAFGPHFLAPLNRLWTAFGNLLHKIVSPLVLALVFFLIFTPLGIVLRILGKSPVRTKWSADSGTYWIDREDKGPAPETMKYQF